MDSATGASSRPRRASSARMVFTVRPTIQRVISGMLVSVDATSFTTVPSRITITRWHTSRISCRRWVIKITAIPRAAMPRMESSRASASFSVSTAVGSSRISSFSWSLLSSRAISVNCLWPTGMSWMLMPPSIRTPIFWIASSAFVSISFRSRGFSRSPKIWLTTLFRCGSRFSRMFSVAVKPGIRENS